MSSAARGAPVSARGIVPARLDSLTGLRFLAMTGIFGYHAGSVFTGTRLGPSARALFRGAPAIVSMFFLLSGFVLMWSQRVGEPRGRFYRRRAARVLPNHLVTWVAGLALASWITGGVHPGPSAASLLLVQTWFPSRAWWFAGDPVSWSLACEALFYALFPLVAGPLLGLGRARRRVLAALLVLGPVVVATVSYASVGDRGYLWLVSYFPLTRAADFVLGMIVAIEVAEGRLSRVPAIGAVLGAVAAYFLAGALPEPFRWVAVPIVPFSLLIAVLARIDAGGGWSPLRRPWAVRLGAWSYAFYLAHVLVVKAALHLVGPHRWTSISASGFFVGLFVLSVAVAGAMFTVVERPLERRFRAARAERTALVEIAPA